MGRNTGHLAFGIGKSSGACLVVIPEDYHKGKFKMEHLLLDLELCIRKRMFNRKHFYGTIILAEGLLTHMPLEDLNKVFGKESTEKDVNALHIDLGKIDIGDYIRDHLRKKKFPFSFHATRLGYELRCADPVPFDTELTIDLGYSAAKFLLEMKGSHCMVVNSGGSISYLPFDKLIDPETGKTKLRFVDIEHGSYRVGAELMRMNRFQKEDLEDKKLMDHLKSCGVLEEKIKELILEVRRYPSLEKKGDKLVNLFPVLKNKIEEKDESGEENIELSA